MNPSDYTLIICFGFAFVVLALALGIAIMALIEVKALQKSTHQIQYVPLDDKGDTVEEENIVSFDELNTKKKLTPEQKMKIEDDFDLFGETEGLD